MSPSSLHEARRPASLGFQATQLTSWPWALGMCTIIAKTGSSGSEVASSLNTRTPSSPQAVAMAPVSRHLQSQQDQRAHSGSVYLANQCLHIAQLNQVFSWAIRTYSIFFFFSPKTQKFFAFHDTHMCILTSACLGSSKMFHVLSECVSEYLSI